MAVAEFHRRRLVLCRVAVLTLFAILVCDGSPAEAQTESESAAADHRVGRVLLIENARQTGQYESVVAGLRKQGFEVEVRDSAHMNLTAAGLQEFDSVILADVPRSDGNDSESMEWIEDQQVSRLVDNTKAMGCGLVLLGGRNSFAAGGWAGSELEKAMPVEFKWRDSPQFGGLVMIMHPAELQQGVTWAKTAAKAAFDQLGPSDHCGVILYTANGTEWLWGEGRGVIPVGDERDELLDKIGSMKTGDFPTFDPAFHMAMDELMKLRTPGRLVLLLTDGDPTPSDDALLARFNQVGIPITVVQIDLHGPEYQDAAKRIASLSGGKYYQVRSSSPQSLERIFAREARKIAHSTSLGPGRFYSLQLKQDGELASVIGQAPPPIKGFTELKAKADASVSIVVVDLDENEFPLLVTGEFGSGRTAVLATDLTSNWTMKWKPWAGRESLIVDIVRWSLKRKE